MKPFPFLMALILSVVQAGLKVTPKELASLIDFPSIPVQVFLGKGINLFAPHSSRAPWSFLSTSSPEIPCLLQRAPVRDWLDESSSTEGRLSLGISFLGQTYRQVRLGIGYVSRVNIDPIIYVYTLLFSRNKI